MQKILVPLDFSESADRALDYAIALAGLTKAREMVVLHVVEPLMLAAPVAAGMPTIGHPPNLLKDLRDSAARELQVRAERVRRASLDVRSTVLEGTAAETIARAAGQEGVDLIVMGTRGRTGLAHVLFGSVAERTVGRTSCPVLLVPVGEEKSEK
jgi:nucleotide-binding universal stress UspA family protein